MLQLDGVYGLLLFIVMQEEYSSFKNCKDFGHEEVCNIVLEMVVGYYTYISKCTY